MKTRKLTIYEALATKLEREPSASELKADWNRMLNEGMAEIASEGKLPHQKGAKR